MKKTLIALAVVAASSTAMAQSSVTLFGIVDAALAHVSANGISKTGITNSGLNSSRFGIRGTEDLGGGLKAGFHLEGALNNDTGTGANGTSAGGLDFRRKSYVTLTGGFGELRVGREYAPTFWNTTIYDPFGTNGVGQYQGPGILAAAGGTNNGAAVRLDNSISYLMSASGFNLHAMWASGENASNVPAKTNDYLGARLNYAAGPLDVSFAFGKNKGAAGPVDVTYTNMGVAYDMGAFKPMFQYNIEKDDTLKASGWLLGVVVPMGAGNFKAAYSRIDIANSANDWNKFAIGYDYSLSKRTILYTTYATVNNKGLQVASVSNNGLSAGAAAPGGTSNGYEFGIRHAF